MAIMIIEDNPDLLYSYSMILTTAGYPVITALQGQAISSMVLNPVQLYIIDYHLPGTDGLTICRELKAHPATAAVPVVMISADTNIKELATRAGADAVLEKPFPREALSTMVNDLLTGRTAV
jgi:DNA-binding response OmpR family regulator